MPFCRISLIRRARLATALAVGASAGAPALALDFDPGNGWQVVWNTSVSVSSSWRMRSQDPSLISAQDGALVGIQGSGGALVDSGDLNYNKGDAISRVLKFNTDLSLSKGDSGGLLRVRGWYDDVLLNTDPRFGNQAQRPVRYANTQPLSDVGLPLGEKFQGVQLMDAYGYARIDLGDHPLQMRLGNQVINWGESLFTQGVNKAMPVDLLAAARGAGTEVKEFLLPIPALYGNLGLGGGTSVEGFYQFHSVSSVVPSCGTYFAPAEGSISTSPGNCNEAAALAGNNRTAAAAGLYLPTIAGPKPKSTGNFGTALRIPVEAIDTEFGLYAESLVPRTPVISVVVGTDLFDGTVQQQAILKAQHLFMAVQALNGVAGMTPAQAFWEYPGTTKIFGISASTTIFGWSTGAELSYQKDVPAQVNGVDLVQGFVGHAGPVVADPRYTKVIATQGGVYHAYDLFNVTQLQVNAAKLFTDVLGAQNLTLAGEFAMQHANVPDYQGGELGNGGLRYGRAFIFGYGALTSGTCNPTNPQPQGCRNDGYDSRIAFGTNLVASLTYNNAFGSGFTATPSVFWKRDIKGYSIDSQFNQGRSTWALGLKMDYAKRFAVDVSYVTFAQGAKYDPSRDRDFLSVALTDKF